jgi:hypothetical protein
MCSRRRARLSFCGGRRECGSVCFFTSFLAIALACQCFLHTALFARLQVEGVTLDFLDYVFLLYFAFETAQGIFKGFTLLNSNLCQRNTPPDIPKWGLTSL